MEHLKTNAILKIAESPKTHWKYSIVAIRCLRTLVRKDAPMKPEHVKHLLLATLDSQYSIVSFYDFWIAVDSDSS